MITKLLVILFFAFHMSMTPAAQKTDIRVVVFDFGGVITHTHANTVADFLMHSFHLNKSEFTYALKNRENFISKGGSEKQFWKQYGMSKGIQLPEDWFEQFTTFTRDSINEIPGSITLVKILQNHGYQTAMLSNVTQFKANIIRKIGYYDLFDPVLLSYAIKVKKPHPKAFKILLEKLEFDASCVLFIDDKLENVEAAKKLGIDSIQFINPQQLMKELQKRGLIQWGDVSEPVGIQTGLEHRNSAIY